MVELTALVGYYTMVAMTLNAHEVPLPDGVAPAFDWPQVGLYGVFQTKSAGRYGSSPQRIGIRQRHRHGAMVLICTWLRYQRSHLKSGGRSSQKDDLVTYCPLDVVDTSGLEPGTDCSGICPGPASDPFRTAAG